MNLHPTENQRIKDLLIRTYEGEAWHGPSVKETLAGVDVAMALRRVPGSHNILELVRHMTAWRRFAIARLEDHRAYEVTDRQNWTDASWAEEADWQEAVESLAQSQQRLMALLDTADDVRFSETVANRPYNFYVLLHGIIQHDLYHLGQIVLLKKSAPATV